MSRCIMPLLWTLHSIDYAKLLILEPSRINGIVAERSFTYSGMVMPSEESSIPAPSHLHSPLEGTLFTSTISAIFLWNFHDRIDKERIFLVMPDVHIGSSLFLFLLFVDKDFRCQFLYIITVHHGNNGDTCSSSKGLRSVIAVHKKVGIWYDGKRLVWLDLTDAEDDPTSDPCSSWLTNLPKDMARCCPLRNSARHPIHCRWNWRLLWVFRATVMRMCIQFVWSAPRKRLDAKVEERQAKNLIHIS